MPSKRSVGPLRFSADLSSNTLKVTDLDGNPVDLGPIVKVEFSPLVIDREITATVTIEGLSVLLAVTDTEVIEETPEDLHEAIVLYRGRIGAMEDRRRQLLGIHDMAVIEPSDLPKLRGTGTGTLGPIPEPVPYEADARD